MDGMMPDTPFYTRLNNRGIVKISGADRLTFLQGLITNDISLLENQPSLYACLLTPQGKFLYDFFITQDNSELVLDCEGGLRAEELSKLLNMYKLRTDVRIDCTPALDVYAVFESKQCGTPDTRHADMGFRSFIKPNLSEKPFACWDDRRIRLCIPDGSRDMIAGQSTMLECRIDTLNGVSFSKGCYLGQELTARTHYRGLVKRHLYTIEADSLPDSGEEIMIDNRIVGEMRSFCGRIGLAILKDDSLKNLYPIKVLSP